MSKISILKSMMMIILMNNGQIWMNQKQKQNKTEKIDKDIIIWLYSFIRFSIKIIMDKKRVAVIKQATDQSKKKTNRKKGKDHIEYRYSKKEKKRIDYIHFHHRFHYVKNIVKWNSMTMVTVKRKKENETMMMIKITLYTLYINKYTIRLHNG